MSSYKEPLLPRTEAQTPNSNPPHLTMSEKLQVAVAGIGRMGMRHARHFATLTPRAELIAVCSPVQAELDAAKKEFGVRTYLSFEDMLAKEKTLQAVVVASATTVHAEQAIKAIEKGYHVLCEKPLSTSPEVVSPLHIPRLKSTTISQRGPK